MDPLLLHTTDTTKFLLPLVVKDGYTYKDIQTNLIGSYISIIEMPTYDQSIILVFNEDVKLKCLKDNYMDNLTLFNADHDVTDHVYIYKIDDSLLEDYVHFIQGDYSLLSESTKQIILKFWDTKEDTFLYSILYKDLSKVKVISEKYNSRNNPWYHTFDTWHTRLKKNKELYRSPDLLKEMYSYRDEL